VNEILDESDNKLNFNNGRKIHSMSNKFSVKFSSTNYLEPGLKMPHFDKDNKNTEKITCCHSRI
jgi:hypothetical protein